jgi:hypothetical protein
MIQRKLTPMKAIKQNCIDCSGGSPKERKNCIVVGCPLYVYRFGKNPNRKNIGNPNPNWGKRKFNLL